MNSSDRKAEILVCDDSEESLRVLVSILDGYGFETRPVTRGGLAVQAARLSPPDLVLLDLRLPDIDGYQVCADLKSHESTCDIPIIFISGLHATEDKVKAFAVGGVDYITKPFQADEIKARVSTHLGLRQMQLALQEQNLRLQEEIGVRHRAERELLQAHNELERRVEERTRQLQETNQKLLSEIVTRERTQEKLRNALHEVKRLRDILRRENVYLREEIRHQRPRNGIAGESPRIEEVLNQIAQVSRTDTTVLILGETGTGKELVAQMIHEHSRRGHRAMVKVDCTALPSGLMENELFGRAKGAYTGAATDQPGRFEIADGSTIFLDEIAELPMDLQAKLLRVIQDGTFERLGSNKTIKTDVRVIAATNKALELEVSEGRFRTDLYYRLNVFPILVPPLRERVSDIPILAQRFIEEFGGKLGNLVKTIDQRTMHAMQRYPWPGNVRELRNLIERSMIISTGEILELPLPEAAQLRAQNVLFEEMARKHILSVLENTNWRIKGKDGAAQMLGLKPTTLQSKMKKLGIRRMAQ